MNGARDRERLELLYGRYQPYGTLEPGDGSERCLVCRSRDARFSFYVWLPSPKPVCGALHAAAVRDRIEHDRLLS